MKDIKKYNISPWYNHIACEDQIKWEEDAEGEVIKSSDLNYIQAQAVEEFTSSLISSIQSVAVPEIGYEFNVMMRDSLVCIIQTSASVYQTRKTK